MTSHDVYRICAGYIHAHQGCTTYVGEQSLTVDACVRAAEENKKIGIAVIVYVVENSAYRTYLFAGAAKAQRSQIDRSRIKLLSSQNSNRNDTTAAQVQCVLERRQA